MIPKKKKKIRTKNDEKNPKIRNILCVNNFIIVNRLLIFIIKELNM